MHQKIHQGDSNNDVDDCATSLIIFTETTGGLNAKQQINKNEKVSKTVDITSFHRHKIWLWLPASQNEDNFSIST